MVNIQHLLQQSLQPSLDPQASALALGITFGIKGLFSRQFADDIRTVGVSHMMVLSGSNISMFMNFISSLLFFLPSKTRETISIFAVIIFLSFIPMQPSILRAALMNIIPRLGVFIGKQAHSMYLLLLTCGLILCFDIHILYDISFQLSFLAVFGIILFHKEVKHEENKPVIVSSILSTIRNQTLLGFSAQAFTVPLIFYYFGNVSLISPVANLLLSPLISPIMAGTILLSISNRFIPLIGFLVGKVLNTLLYSMIHIIEFLSRAKILYIHY